MKLNKKTALAAIAALALVAGGTATVMDYFGQSTGTVDVENQAIAVSDNADYSYSPVAAPETYVEQVDLTNNNEDRIERVTVLPEVTSSTQSGQTVSIQDVEESKTVTTDSGVKMEIAFNEDAGEIEFTPTDVTTYNQDGGTAGVVFGFDTDNDDNYEFQVDTVSSGLQPDLYEYTDQSTGKGDFVEHYDFNSAENSGDGTSEHNGVFFTDSSTQLKNKDSFTLTVDAERLGSSFSLDAEQDSSTFLDDNWDGSTASEYNAGEEVTGSEVILDGAETRTYAIFTEIEAGHGSTTYTTDVGFSPVTQ